jgi:hypothetical protein
LGYHVSVYLALSYYIYKIMIDDLTSH